MKERENFHIKLSINEEKVKVTTFSFCLSFNSFLFLAYNRFRSLIRGSSAMFLRGSNFSSWDDQIYMKNNKCIQKTKHTDFLLATHTSVRSSGKLNISLISSGLFPSIIRASARLVRSTKGFNWRLSAADVNSHNLFVSSRTNFSSKVLRSYKEPQVKLKLENAYIRLS